MAFFRRFIKREQTRTDEEPIKTHEEPTRNPPGMNQNHEKIDQ